MCDTRMNVYQKCDTHINVYHISDAHSFSDTKVCVTFLIHIHFLIQKCYTHINVCHISDTNSFSDVSDTHSFSVSDTHINVYQKCVSETHR